MSNLMSRSTESCRWTYAERQSHRLARTFAAVGVAALLAGAPVAIAQVPAPASPLTINVVDVAGDLALTLGARGGVYIAGGIVVQLGDLVASSRLRERFEAKGRYRAYLEGIPTSLIVDASGLALRGADAALDA